MGKSSIFLKAFNILVPTLDQIYIFQLEEYQVGRYLKTLPRFFFKRNLQKHDTLKYTKYIKTLLIVIGILFIIVKSIFLSFFPDRNLLITFSILLLSINLVSPILIIKANLILKPYYSFKSNKSKKQAKQKILSLQGKGLKVVGITGSFGKTTTKNLIYQLTKDTYRVQFTPGNINTAIGIANWINNSLQDNTQIVILEMGAYKKGEIKECVEIGNPDIAVITTIGKQHMERFKKFENIIQAKLEIFDYSKEDTIRICPANIQTLIPKREYKIEFVGTQKNEKELPSGIRMNYPLAKKVAEILSVHPEVIKSASGNIEIPDRRGNVSNYKEFTLIDNSYNISFETAQVGLKDAKDYAKKESKKLVLITGGIPETGSESKEINEKYSKKISEYSDYTLVLKTIYHKYLISSLDKNTYTFSESMSDALNQIEERFSPEDVIILCQPELTDLSY